MNENKEIIINQLIDEPLTIPSVLIKNYAKLGLTEGQLVLLLHLRKYMQEGNSFPTPQDLESRMTISADDCTALLKELLKRGFITIEENHDTDGKLAEIISIKPTYEKLAVFINNEMVGSKKQTKQFEEGQLYRRFEEEFSRPITPMELEMISMWLDEDKHAPQMIEAALREAVVSSKLNFRYIDRILYDWKKNGVRTLSQAKQHGEKIRQHHSSPKQSTTQKTRHPHYNWLQS
ncbi:DnaD domain-containing protein [Evansella cellulosilytica]|uniref:Primosome, DnaD subunit n=1 Tax=Evansella cellulosilytica (strain ATCC 21833 / DSM 2522 / FERM P-1141 / JCM 9156 / N-4) TaxID=649639 RepID=E6TZK1_EVAC2|nr:DnaD domain-containing protein [Evansella cellulosilytica]ADU30175.1 primosome, DnaD subunit [Evansella cellulosilytica DSM 2522]